MKNYYDNLWKTYSEKSDPDKGVFIDWWVLTTGKTYKTLMNKFHKKNSQFTEKEFELVSKKLGLN